MVNIFIFEQSKLIVSTATINAHVFIKRCICSLIVVVMPIKNHELLLITVI